MGQGLFEFGDRDGTGPEVRLQHCLGVAYGDGKLFIADTYNNKVKVADPRTQAVKTLAGDGKPGAGDKPPRFYQPGGLSVAGTSLYVADTNNHVVRVIDLKTGDVRTLKLEGLNPPQAEPKVAAAGRMNAGHCLRTRRAHPEQWRQGVPWPGRLPVPVARAIQALGPGPRYAHLPSRDHASGE